MDENGEILLLHASKNNARPLVLPWFDDFAFKSFSQAFHVKVTTLFFSNDLAYFYGKIYSVAGNKNQFIFETKCTHITIYQQLSIPDNPFV